MVVQVLIRLQRIHRRVKPDESSVFMCHLLHHQYIITQQGTHAEWSLYWGQDSLVLAQAQTPALWFSPAEDFASSPRMLWCWTRHEAHAAFSHWEHYLVSSLIAGCLSLWGLMELRILWLLWLHQIRVKSANRFICHSQGLRHTGTAENPSKPALTGILSFHLDVRPVVTTQLIERNAALGKIPCEFSRARISPNN